MKKLYRIIVLILVSLVFINNINATETYIQGEIKASNYINTTIDYKNTYNRYIYTNLDPQVYSKVYKGETSGKFKYGGLLSYNEFKITKNGREKNEYSYLYNSSEFWTYTQKDDEMYVVSTEIDKTGKKDSTEDKYKIKVTEIVMPTVNIKGEGTYSNPWIFEPKYTITLRTNDGNKGKISEIDTDEQTNKQTLISFEMAANDIKDIYVYPESGYEYIGNTCGIIMNDIDIRNNRESKKVKILSISRNIECTVNFGEKNYAINLAHNGQYEDASKPEPKTIYVNIDKGWYNEPTGTFAISYLNKAPSLAGYTFKGYYDETNYRDNKFKQSCYGNKIIDENRKLASPSATKKENDKDVSIYKDNMTIHPCFEPITYTVKYNCGNNDDPVATSTHVYNIEKNLLNSSTICSKTGYTFAGWARDINGTNPERFYDNTNYSQITPNSEITLYAQWTPNQYTITYNLGNATSTAGTKTIGTQTCTFDSDCTLTPFLSINSSYPFPYSYEYEQKDTTNNKNYGWSFYGWTTNQSIKPNANDKIDINYTDNQKFKYTIAENISLYAIGERIIHFNGGISPTAPYKQPKQYWNPYSTNNSYVSNLDVPTAQTIETWSFIGYKCGSSEASNSNITMAPSIAGTKYKLEYNKYPYTRSVYSRTLTMEYNANGGTGTTNSQTQTQYYNSGYGKKSMNHDANETNVPFELSESKFSRIGYKFQNWTEDSSTGIGYDAKSIYNFKPSVSSKVISKTMYAKWLEVSYVVKFNANGGKGSIANKTYKYDQENTLPANTFEKTGYTFAGWGINENDTEIKYTDKQKVKNLTTNTEIILYAIWEPQSITITFDSGYSEVTPNPKTKNVSYEKTYGTLPIVQIEGYKFLGWFTEKESGTKVTSETKVTSLKNHTLYAQWETPRIDLLLMFKGSGTNNFTSFVKSEYQFEKAVTYTGQTTQGKWESFSIRMNGLEEGSTYQLKFDASFSDRTSIRDNTTYPIGCKVEDHQHYAAKESKEDYVWEPTDVNKSTKGFVIEFKATKTTMYWLWELSKIRNPGESYGKYKPGVTNYAESYFDLTLENIELKKIK